MKKWYLASIILVLAFGSQHGLSFREKIRSNPEFIHIFRALWGDDLESKIDVIDANTTTNLATEGTINTMVTNLSPTALTTSLISSGTIALNTAGNYALAEDMTADINISASNISLDLNHRALLGLITVDGGGSGISDIYISNGYIRPPAPFASADSAITIASDALRVNVTDVMIVCNNTTASGLGGRTCIKTAGDYTTISDCYLVSGNGGATAAAGDGIELTSTSTYATVEDCFIITGNGGTGGGRGGHGVYVNGASLAIIHDSTVNFTGNGSAAQGGDGVNITSTSTEIEVRNCLLRNMGSGSPSGRAVNDFVPAADPGKSIIWSNIATKIILIKYNIGAAGIEKGVSLIYPTTTDAVNVYANVYASP